MNRIIRERLLILSIALAMGILISSMPESLSGVPVSTKQTEDLAPAQAVELFDISQGKVVKRFPLTEKLRREAETLLQASNRLIGAFRMEPKQGYAVHITFVPPTHADLEAVHGDVKEMYIFVSSNESPYLLIFGEKTKPIFLQAGSDVAPILEAAGLHGGLRTK